MGRRTWKKDSLYITYGNPRITPHRVDTLKSMKDVMYFYYDQKFYVPQAPRFSHGDRDFFYFSERYFKRILY